MATDSTGGNSRQNAISTVQSDVAAAGAGLDSVTGGGTTTGKSVYSPFNYLVPNPYKRVSINGQTQITQGNSARYKAEDAQTWLNNLVKTPGAVDEMKRQAYYAGFYDKGAKPLVMGDTYDESDIKALYNAMDFANRNGGIDVSQAITQRAAASGGLPLGQETDPSKSPAYQLQSFLGKNGLKMGDDFVQQNVRRIMSGDTSVDEVKNYVRDRYLANAYPAWADQIKAGADVADLASPYIQKMSQLLEVPEESIDLADPNIQKAMAGVNADGKPSYKPLWQFEQDVRQDPRWLQTNSAQDEISNTAADVLKTFGFMG